jgi:general secretion pathway protein F
MPTFHYKAVGNNGEPIEGHMEAPSQEIVIDRLQSAGHLPIRANEISSAENKKNYNSERFKFNKNKIRTNDVVIFTREMATLLNAGLPLDQALKLLNDLAESTALKTLITDINNRIQSGSTLSAAMEAQGSTFSRLYLNTIRAGEASGALSIVLSRLADYLERSTELRNSVISALLYPAILFVVSLLSIFVLMIFVIPQFEPLFEDMGKALPFLTQVVFGCADIVRQYWWLFIGTSIFILWFGDRQLQNPEIRFRWDAWCLRLPLIGDLIAKLEVARFARTLGTLLSNGVSILTAISIVQEVFSNQVLAKVIQDATSSLEQGHGLSKPLQQSRQFPALAVQLIHVGEETGQLENMLIKIADIYDNESKTTIKRLLTMVEPIMILGMGAVISIIIVSILTAMLGLNDLIG